MRKPTRHGPVKSVVRTLAKQIRTAREVARLTQEEAAERSLVPPKRYQAIEAGDANLTVSTIARIAAAFGLSVSELTGLDVSKKRGVS